VTRIKLNELVTNFLDSREAAETWLRGVG